MRTIEKTDLTRFSIVPISSGAEQLGFLLVIIQNQITLKIFIYYNADYNITRLL